jgi:hypothetical protein
MPLSKKSVLLVQPSLHKKFKKDAGSLNALIKTDIQDRCEGSEEHPQKQNLCHDTWSSGQN